MNERDYLIAESMVLAGGAFIVATVVCMMLIFHIVPDLSIFLIMSFIAFSTFFFGLFFHMKRRIFELEMMRLAQEAKDGKMVSDTAPRIR